MKIPGSRPKILYSGKLSIALVIARFNDSLGSILLENTRQELVRHGVTEEKIKIIRVPGALEIPLTAKMLAQQRSFDVIIALGVILKGSTPHFEYVSQGVYQGLMQVNLNFHIPVVFGVLTCLNVRQARERVLADSLNKGKEFAETALEMAFLIKSLRKK